jgi:hypothetical protein
MMNGWEDVEVEGHVSADTQAEPLPGESEAGDLPDLGTTAPTAQAY